MAPSVVPDEEDLNCATVVFAGVTVAITVGINAIEVIVQGDLPNELVARFVEEVHCNTEEVIGRRCVLEAV